MVDRNDLTFRHLQYLNADKLIHNTSKQFYFRFSHTNHSEFLAWLSYTLVPREVLRVGIGRQLYAANAKLWEEVNNRIIAYFVILNFQSSFL